jgi:hypothetical protein
MEIVVIPRTQELSAAKEALYDANDDGGLNVSAGEPDPQWGPG